MDGLEVSRSSPSNATESPKSEYKPTRYLKRVAEGLAADPNSPLAHRPKRQRNMPGVVQSGHLDDEDEDVAHVEGMLGALHLEDSDGRVANDDDEGSTGDGEGSMDEEVHADDGGYSDGDVFD